MSNRTMVEIHLQESSAASLSNIINEHIPATDRDSSIPLRARFFVKALMEALVLLRDRSVAPMTLEGLNDYMHLGAVESLAWSTSEFDFIKEEGYSKALYGIRTYLMSTPSYNKGDFLNQSPPAVAAHGNVAMCLGIALYEVHASDK